MPARKETRFMSSSVEVLRGLSRRCEGDHVHQPLLGGRARAAAVYPPALCRAILRGIERQRRVEGEPVPKHIENMVDTGRAIYNLARNDPEYEEVTLDSDVQADDLPHEDDAWEETYRRMGEESGAPSAGPHGPSGRGSAPEPTV